MGGGKGGGQERGERLRFKSVREGEKLESRSRSPQIRSEGGRKKKNEAEKAKRERTRARKSKKRREGKRGGKQKRTA